MLFSHKPSHMRRSANFILSGCDHVIVNISCTEVTLYHLIDVNLLIHIINLNTEIVLYFLNPYQD